MTRIVADPLGRRALRQIALAVAMTSVVLAAHGLSAAGPPAEWLDDWSNPPAKNRPLQIIHGYFPNPPDVGGMRRYLDLGLGGVVCNVSFSQYLQSESHWQTLIAGVEACRELGLVVWLYDEEGYPSAAAGGLVLAEDPAFEATELAYDPTRDDPFVIRPAYEYSHASNNHHAARRCPNLIDDRAIRCFIRKTHEAYFERLAPHFGRTIEAVFTDEPSLMAVNIGQIPEEIRKKVPVVDPLDPAVKMLPRVPWCYDLPRQYQERYGEDLLPRRRSLFVGETVEDRRTRERFWSLVADLVAERYFGAIQNWCAGHRIASSGHSLWEEQLLHHVPLEGNGLKALTRMDIPGLDMLSSDPEAVIHSGWLTAGLPSSAAMLNGTRRVMTEVSDFSQKLGPGGPVGLAEMQATAAWQATWGVTDFTLYYGTGDRPQDDYRAYCRYVGRLNGVLKEAKLDRNLLLYYPIRDLWAEYLPVAEPLNLQSQSPKAQRICGSFARLGQTLQRSQIPFTLIDHEHLARAEAGPGGRLAVGGRQYDFLVLPEDVELPPAAASVAETFRQRGGRVLLDATNTSTRAKESLLATVGPEFAVSPASDRIALGRFTRDGRRILLIVNVGAADYAGRLSVAASSGWQAMDPASGAIGPVASERPDRLPLNLTGRQAILLVENE
jgi:hypothetical protein